MNEFYAEIGRLSAQLSWLKKNLACMSRVERLAMLERDHPKLLMKVQAELLRLSYSSLFYQPVPPSEWELAIKRRIDEIYTAHPCYGSRKITEELRPEFGVARSMIQRYMQEMGIFALVPGPHTSKPTPEHQIFPYLLRGVTATHPNDIWGIDITYVRLAHGWLYLTAILDWYSRYIVSWALSQTLALDFVQRWTMLCSRPHPRSGTATRAATLPVISTSNACKTLVFKSVWTGAVGLVTTSSPNGSGPSNTKKFTCMTMLVQRRHIDS
jgi:putative transposase